MPANRAYLCAWLSGFVWPRRARKPRNIGLIRPLAVIHRMTLLNSRTGKAHKSITNHISRRSGQPSKYEQFAPLDAAAADEIRAAEPRTLATNQFEKSSRRSSAIVGRRDAIMRWGQPYSTAASSKRHCSRSSAGARWHVPPGPASGSFHDREKTGGVPFLTLRTCGVRRLEIDLSQCRSTTAVANAGRLNRQNERRELFVFRWLT
jgi:hypothetical protein